MLALPESPSPGTKTVASSLSAQQLLAEFEAAWRNGGNPVLREYVEIAARFGPEVTHTLRNIDLEHRGSTARPTKVPETLNLSATDLAIPLTVIAKSQPSTYATSTAAFRASLRWRLLAVLPTCFLIWAIVAVASVVFRAPLLRQEVSGLLTQVLTALATQVFLVEVALLAWWRDWPLIWLRRFEAAAFVIFGSTLASYMVFGTNYALREAAHDPVYADQVLTGVAQFSGLGWLSLLLIFGRALPSSPRRTAILSGVIVGIPVAIYGGYLAADWSRFTLLDNALLFTTMSLGIAVSFAWFCNFDAAELQQQVQDARDEARAALALGPYILKRRLGQGGMGNVYLAEHRLLKRPCAVKVVRLELLRDPDIRARFEREAQATARLSHPNTVEVFDFGQAEDGAFYYVMEYLDGLCLNTLLKHSGPQPPQRVIHILRQLCGALAEAHAAGLVHRDIKPSNVVLCRQGGVCDVAKLVDFGLVRVGGVTGQSHDATREGLFLGTPHYASPEQIDSAAIDGRSDIYNLGGTAFHLLSGRPPFVAPSVIDILHAHRHSPPPCFAELELDVPAGLEAIIRRCLEKSPGERYASALELERDLTSVANELPAWTDADARKWWSEQPVEPAEKD